MNTIPTLAPTPARLLRRFVAALHACFLEAWLRAAERDMHAYHDQADYCEMRATICGRRAAELRQRLHSIR